MEHLHRLVTQASAEAQRLDGAFDAAREADGLEPALLPWSEAAEALEEAVARAHSTLVRDGSPKEQISRIRERLSFVRKKARQFSLDDDLYACVESWNGVGMELGQLSGREGDALVRLLERHKPAIDRSAAMLSQAREDGGHPGQGRKLAELRQQRDRAREKYERLRQAYLVAQRDFEAAQKQKAAVPGAEEHVVLRLPPLPLPVAPKALHQLVAREAGRSGVADRFERTISQLATAEHRALPDPSAAEIRAQLARMDSILARLSGKGGDELAQGARSVGAILLRISVLMTRVRKAQAATFGKLIEERKGQLHRIAQAQLSVALVKPSPAGLPALGGTRTTRSLGTIAQESSTALKLLLDPSRPRKASNASFGAVLAEHGSSPAAALHDAVQAHPKHSAFAAHLAPGGPLRALCETAQRGHGLPIGQAAQHYLATRGSSHLWNAVATFNTLTGQGHVPRFSFGSWLKKNVSDHASGALEAVSRTARGATHTLSDVTTGVGEGISSLGRAAGGELRNIGRSAVDTVKRTARGVDRVVKKGIDSVIGEINLGAHALARVSRGGLQAVQSGASWAEHKAGAAARWAEREASGGPHWLAEKVHSGLEWAHKTGVAGAIGTGLRRGLSFVKGAVENSPLGLAVRKGYGFVKSGGLVRAWNAAKHGAGAAWGGLKSAAAATSTFLQSPAGKLLVTGLSLAASFVPGGILVKAAIGAGIGAIQAISEGKDWKAALASAAGGALTGAIPFLKMGPLAKVGVGALQGGITALASGGSLKDALKGAGGGVIDAFEPGAFHALKNLRAFKAAGKLLKGKRLQGASGPVRALEKALEGKAARKVMGALEQISQKGRRGGIWVSGKAARAQHVLDKVVGTGERVHGALEQIHDLAPGLSQALGDNAFGHAVGRAGEWAGAGDERLKKALEYGHTASDKLTQARGTLDKALGYAGVRDPAKAYEKMSARRDLVAGKKGALERVAELKLEEHRQKHPELHPAEARQEPTRTAHEEDHPVARKRPEPDPNALAKALARGRGLAKQGQRVAQGVHDKLGKVHDVAEKGLAGAGKVQSGLEQATKLARQGAEIFGGDSELGQYLAHVADRAEQIHGRIQSGLEVAQKINEKVGAVHSGLEKIPGVRKEGEKEEEAVFLEGAAPKKPAHAEGPAEKAPAPAATPETAEQKAARLSKAWERIGSISRQVQKFELESGKTQRHVQELLQKGSANQAGIALMGLGSWCDSIDRAIREAKELSKGHEPYEKEVAFYQGWQKQTRAKLHEAIAAAKGLGGQVAVSGFGIEERTHKDIFENTRAIYAVRTKVQSFGAALHDEDAKGQVEKVLAEARQAKRDLEALKAKYGKDPAAHAFLTGGGTQDKLIDEVLAKLEGPAKKEEPAKEAAPKPGFAKRVESGLEAVEKLRQKAVEAGPRVESGLEKLDKGLGTGIRIGSKVDSGLEKLAGLAEQVSGMLGEDSPLGHLAHQIGQGAGKGHEKLHDALGAAEKGKGFLEKGREILHRGLEVAEGHHAKTAEEVLRTGWELIKGLIGGGKTEAPKPDARGAAEAVQNALQWVTSFGQEVAAAIQEIESLMQGGRAQDAGSRIQAMNALADQVRAEIAAAVEAAAQDPKLAAQASSAQKHYLELRSHFADFVEGLHGPGGADLEAKDRPAKPGIDQLIEHILHVAGGRVHADRSGVSGEVDVQDLQDVDPAAIDTWIGSGEGAMPFPVVFAEFLPAEGVAAPQGFFAKLFGRLEGFADRIGGWAKRGSSLLGKGMHSAETGMHGLSRIEGAAGSVQGYAGRAEKLLDRMGLHRLATVAGKVGGAAGWVDEESETVHGGLKTADAWMGKGKHAADEVGHGAEVASGMFGEAAHGRFGSLVNLFRASKDGDGVDGRLAPERVAVGSVFDEPRRLDVSTLSRMESYLGGDFSGVRIHTGPGAAEVTHRFNAEAVTVKDHVFFAPGRFSPGTVEGQRLIAHELTHVLQKGRSNLDVRTAEGEALRAEHGYGVSPPMETLNLRPAEPGFRLAADGEGMGASSGIHTAKRTRSRGHEVGGRDAIPDGEEMIERISGRVYELLMEELEQAFESR